MDVPIKTEAEFNLKFEAKKEIKDTVSLQIGLDVIEKLDLPVKSEIEDDWNPDILVQKEPIVPKSGSADDINSEKSYCTLCQVEFPIGTLDKHLNGKRHNRIRSVCSYCTLCKSILREKEVDGHLNGKKHNRKLYSKFTNPNVNYTDFIITDPTKMPYYCDLCQVPCGSQTSWYSHLNGKQHGENKHQNKVNTEKENSKENEFQKGATLFTEGFKNKKRDLDKTFYQNDSNLTYKKFKKEA